jgi:hypothetical protein
MVMGKRYQVFSIKETREREGKTNSVWVKAGSAWVNRDGSLNVYLDVLPLDGRLHVREALEKREGSGDGRTSSTGEPSAFMALEADSMGGH